MKFFNIWERVSVDVLLKFITIFRLTLIRSFHMAAGLGSVRKMTEKKRGRNNEKERDGNRIVRSNGYTWLTCRIHTQPFIYDLCTFASVLGLYIARWIEQCERQARIHGAYTVSIETVQKRIHCHRSKHAHIHKKHVFH